MNAPKHEDSPRVDAAPEFVFYDGSCGLCHHGVRFLLARDRDGTRFRFAPLGGETFERLVGSRARAALPDSILMRTEDGELFARSRAVLHAMVRLGGAWRAGARVARVIPTPVLDFVYDRVASIRHRVFARPKDACPLASAQERARFEP